MANLLTIGIIVFSVIFIVASKIFKLQTKLAVKPGKSFLNFKKYLGLTIEQGKRLHISLGSNSILDKNSASYNFV